MQADVGTAPPAVPELVTPEKIRRRSEERGEPAWLTRQRVAAAFRAAELSVPTQTTPSWRRTDLRRLDLPALLGRGDASRHVEAHGMLAENMSGLAGSLTLRDGQPTEQMLLPELEKKGVILTSLRQAVERYPNLVQPHLGRLVSGVDQGGQASAELPSIFVSLAAALWEDGLFLYVPRGVGIEQPILSRMSRTTGGALFTRSLIVVDEGAEVTLVEDTLSDDEAGEALVSGTVEIVTGQASRVRYANLQEWSAQTWSFNRLKSETGRDSRIDWLFVAVGGKVHRAEIDASLTGQGSETDLVGLIFGTGDQHFDHQTLQDHLGNDTRSDLHFKAALDDSASSNYQGLIRVNKTSLRTDSNLEDRNLLLSNHSRAEADPQLEILNSDVIRCAHGATVGPLDREMIFYIESRGVPREEAQRLVVEAFFEEVLSRIPVPALKASVWEAVQRKLGREHSTDNGHIEANEWQIG
ncbi:MAG: Fe-S cluster assembly protein SufD [Chloroflexi bacterium]|nr:Fe-S cluster assembly protein SufD [Chloroflexota bacterium]